MNTMSNTVSKGGNHVRSLQSHYTEVARAGRHFYGTENEIWAGFGPVGNTEKKMPDYEHFLRSGFFMFLGANFFSNLFKNIIAYALKSSIK